MRADGGARVLALELQIAALVGEQEATETRQVTAQRQREQLGLQPKRFAGRSTWSIGAECGLKTPGGCGVSGVS